MNVRERFGKPEDRREAIGGTGAQASRNATIGAPSLARGVDIVRRHPLLSIALVIVLVAAIAYTFLPQADAAGKPIIATVERGNVENVVTAIGSLQPLNFVDVGAQVSGQLKTLSVMVGDRVQKGDLVAEIDSAVASAKVDADKAQLQNLYAQLSDRQSNLTLATIQADRQSRLKAENATSQDAFDSAQAALRSAQAQVKAVQAQITQSESTLKADQATLGYAKIYAPMTGTISSITAKQGQTLNANQQAPTILQVADLSIMTVSTQVSEADVPKLRVGMDAYFTTLGAPERRWTGKLRQILPTPTVVNNVVLYTALFDVANPTNELMTQMTAQVFFILSGAYDVIKVPVSALKYAERAAGGGNETGQRAQGERSASAQGASQGRRQSGAGRRGGQAGAGTAQARPRAATVSVVKDDGDIETRNVIVGVSDRVNAEIRSGLAEGENIIVGYEVPNTNKSENDNNNNKARGPGGPGGFGGGRGPGGFGGFGATP